MQGLIDALGDFQVPLFDVGRQLVIQLAFEGAVVRASRIGRVQPVDFGIDVGPHFLLRQHRGEKGFVEIAADAIGDENILHVLDDMRGIGAFIHLLFQKAGAEQRAFQQAKQRQHRQKQA